MLASLAMRTQAALCGSQAGLLRLPRAVRPGSCLVALCLSQLSSRQPFPQDALLLRHNASSTSSSSGKRGGVAATAARHSAATAATAAVEERIEEKELHVEASEAYLSYAMSVIVGRALPDVRDGLKPVHRRILFAMHELGISHSKPFKKCARVVGEVLGKYHPHGDTAVYDALVRLAQDFSMQLPLVSGQGNFGSLDDDPPAAMRYTECRLASAAEELLLADLEADTVDFATTFDASQEEPLVLPAKVPHLLVNGTQGIAVGIATKIPPHNLQEVVAALRALIDQPDISTAQLMQHIPAPDFPTGGELLVGPETAAAYKTGNGSVVLRATGHIEYEGSGSGGKKRGSSTKGKKGAAGAAAGEAADGAAAAAAAASGKALVVFTEMPYQVCKADLVQRIAELVEAKSLDGVADVRDESDRTGVRLVVEVKRGFSPELVLNQLYKNTRLQLRFASNMVALVDGVPRSLTLKACLQHFLDFRITTIQRRARHRLGKAEARLHLVEGLLTALAQLDAVVQAVRAAPDSAAGTRSADVAALRPEQRPGRGCAGMTLRRLTGLEAGKLQEEQRQLAGTIADLQDLLASQERQLQIVLQEAQAAADKHGTPRRSRIVTASSEAAEQTEEDVVPNTPSLMTVSSRGFIKRMPSSTWEAQRRGGKGKSTGKLRDNDALEQVLSLMAHDTLLFLSARGRAHSVKAYRVPEASRAASGSAISQVLGLPAPETFLTMLPVGSFAEGGTSLVMATSAGGIKRTPLAAFSSIQRNGLAAIKLSEGEQLAAGGLASEGSTVVLASSGGMLAHFAADNVRCSSRTAGCIKGIKIKPGQQLVSMTVLPPDVASMVAVQAAAAKEAAAAAEDGVEEDSSSLQEAPAGTAASSSSPRSSRDESTGPWLLMISSKGFGKRVPLAEVPLKLGRGLLGVAGMKLEAGDSLAMALLVHSKEDDIVMASRQGMMARCRAADVRIFGRPAKGVKMLGLNEGDEVQTVAVVPAEHKTALA
ncbi:DNA topoisomerase [Scenedesmus sp. NREL 46B-D3]|nr:DNA topoisomerase [Scenedesmus sp. NREL 46B-D3]